jgi:hypothetical protein
MIDQYPEVLLGVTQRLGVTVLFAYPARDLSGDDQQSDAENDQRRTGHGDHGGFMSRLAGRLVTMAASAVAKVPWAALRD